jgi:DNA repair exonuclease SbcCD ATPase subunit
MKKFIIQENQLKQLVRVLREQEDDNEYYEMTGKEFEELMDQASYNPAVTRIKRFKGKPLYITTKLDLSGNKELTNLGNVVYVNGDLNVSQTNLTNFGNLTYVNGSLNISGTKITSLGNVKVKTHIFDENTPIEARRIREAELVKEAEADGRREDGEWELDNPDIDEEGLAANALFNMLVNKDELNEMDEEIKDEIKSKMERHKEIQEIYGRIKDTASEEELEELENENIELLNEIEELKEEVADVYYIIPENYKPYGNLHSFTIVGKRGVEYMVGLYENMYDAAVQNQEDLLDGIEIEALSGWLIESNIDKQQVRDFMEESYWEWITDSPESYFDKDDFKLTDEQEERKEELENYINEMEELKTKKEEKLENIEDGDSDEYTQLKKEIDEIDKKIEKAQDELDSIEPDYEPTEEMIEKQVKYYVRTTDEIDWLKEHGYDLKYYVDMNGVAKDIVDQDGLGVLSGYNGNYDDVFITGPDGTRHNFVIVRTN